MSGIQTTGQVDTYGIFMTCLGIFMLYIGDDWRFW